MPLNDTNPKGPANKEKEPQRQLPKEMGQEKADIIEIGRSPELSSELEGYLEKIEKEDHFLPNQVLDDQTGQPLVTSPEAEKPTIILPLTFSEYNSGLKKSVKSSWRWLAEWSKRLVKIFGAQVGFKE
ncbi:MAG: hypothetical protein XD98_0485 [Microgenomates bacterium 39_6]|nr:MAG: hypothetical protein XD98_0485 [Microgenomates bacterium 39_6]